MISADELRLGNLISLSGDYKYNSLNGDIRKVIALAIDDIVTIGFAGNSAAFEPIKLTPEILLKCGFIKSSFSFGGYITEKDFGIFIFYHQDMSVQLVEMVGTEYENCINPVGKYKYLHQLQNLYWCLCGEELKINL